MGQFSVPRNDDFSIRSLNVTYREEANGLRTLKGGGLYSFNNNSGFYSRNNNPFFPVIEIKNAQGTLLHTIKNAGQKIPSSSATLGMNYSFSYSENKPYNILKDKALSTTVKFLSGRGSRRPRYPDGSICNKNCSDTTQNFSGLISSRIYDSPLITLVNVEEETRLNNIEKARLAVIEKSRLANIEEKRLADIELRRLTKLKNNMLLLAEIRRNKIDVGEERLIELLNIEKNQMKITPSIDPAVLPSIVATSSLIPLGVLAILLINSSRGKK